MWPFKKKAYKMLYSFDGTTITVASDDPHWKIWATKQGWTPCEHIKGLIASLIAKGAEINAADTGWSTAKLVVTMSKGLNANAAESVAKDRGLAFYENNDQHYLVAYGWYCEKCAQGLDWPQQKATIDAI